LHVDHLRLLVPLPSKKEPFEHLWWLSVSAFPPFSQLQLTYLKKFDVEKETNACINSFLPYIEFVA